MIEKECKTRGINRLEGSSNCRILLSRHGYKIMLEALELWPTGLEMEQLYVMIKPKV